MRLHRELAWLTPLGMIALAVVLQAQTAPAPASAPTTPPVAAPDGRQGRRAGAPGTPGTAGARGGATTGERTPIPGATEPPKLIFHEAWTRAPLAQPITQANLGNQNLVLHIYGNADHIRKAMHPLDDYTYTGETTSNWALTVSDPANSWDATGGGRFRMKTQNTGWRFTHVIIKTLDGRFYASEEGAGESSVFMETDFVLQDLHWRNLLMTDTPSNASNRRQPDPKRIPIVPTSKATPDLSKIDEIGFSDLMEGGWIPATSRIAAFEFYGRTVARK